MIGRSVVTFFGRLRPHVRDRDLRGARVGLSLALSGVAAVASVIGATAMSASAKGSRAAGSHELIVDLAGGISTLDPAEACGTYDVGMVGNFYARLTQYGTRPGPGGTTQINPGKIVPYFAKSWKISPNGKTYTFSLHSGAKFPDGKPMDAQAVKYSIDRLLTTNGCGASFVLDNYFTPPLIRSIDVPNATTVVFHLNLVDPNFPQDLAQPAAGIVEPSVVNANGGVKKDTVNTWMTSHTAGSGPFILKQYQPNTSALLVRNPAFFGPRTGSQQILVRFIGSDPTLLLNARTGKADVTLGLLKQSAASLKNNPCCKLVVNQSANSEWLVWPFNHANGPFTNSKFREALTYAIPYQQILKHVAYGYGALYYGPFPPFMTSVYNPALEKARTFDLSKAKKLLRESGISTPVNVSMIVNGAVPLDGQIATILQASWKEVGVNLTVHPVSLADLEHVINHGQTYQTAIHLDGPGVIDGGYYLGYDMLSTQPYDWGGVKIPAADRLLPKARQEQNPAKRRAIYDKIIKLWVAASAKVPIFADANVTVLSKRVTSYMYSHELDMRTWAAR